MRPKKKIKSTTCKFYNKWNLKISFIHKETSLFRKLSFDEIETSKQSSEFAKKLVKFLKPYDQSSYIKRIENKILDIYTNDLEMFESLLNDFEEHIRIAYKPDNNNEQLLSNPYTIVAKNFPHKKYQFKVFLQPHKITNKEEKLRYIDWLDTQETRVKITEPVKKWFYKTQWNWDRRYMYVEDEKTLFLLKLRMPEALGTVYNYVLSDK